MDGVRQALADALRARVAGPDAVAAAERIAGAPGPRWFDDDRPIRRVHADASMFPGGIRALLLQSLHPLAMAAVAGHSGFRADPWGRLQRTAHFLATTTYGTAADAEAAVAKVRGVHRRVHGTAPDGRSYAASDPHLLRWVHVAEVDSFLRAYQRYGSRPLTSGEADGYVADTALVAGRLGVVDPPRSTAQLAAAIAGYRPQLRGTDQARDAARFLLLTPPVPLTVRPVYGVLGAAAVSLLPWWSRWPLRLPLLPVAEAALLRPAGTALTTALRWVMTADTTAPAKPRRATVASTARDTA